MSGWRARQDVLTRVNKLERGQFSSNRFRSPYDPGDRPGPVQNVVLEFRLREKKNDLQFSAVVKWDPIPPGTCAADIRYFSVEIRPTNSSGGEKDFGRKKREQVVVKDPDDLDVDNLKTTFTHIEHPKLWFWQARVSAVDQAGQKGQWSPWTLQNLPYAAALPKPPAPGFVILNFDKNEHQRHNPWRCVVSWPEIGPWDIPPVDGRDDEQDRQDDVARYKAELRRCDAAGNFVFGDGRANNVEAKDQDAGTTGKAVFHNIKRRRFYRARVRSIDRFNRRGDWSVYSAVGTPSDTTKPPRPFQPARFGSGPGCHVDVENHSVAVDWDAPDDPDDLDTDSAIDLRSITDEIAYFQVQLASTSAFSSIIRRDAYVSTTSKTFNIRKPTGVYWARVRSVDGSNNKSEWAYGSGNKVFPPTPNNAPAITFRHISGATTPLRGVLKWAYNPAGYADDEIAHYVIKIQESIGNIFQTGDASTADPTWRIFVNDPKGDDPDSDRLDETFNRVNTGHWYRARFKAVDNQGRASAWGPWSSGRQAPA